jgi:hypothetical protein
MTTLTRKSQMQILLAFLLLMFSHSTLVANQLSPQSNESDSVKLTVLSSCAPASIRLSTGEVVKTPFQRIFGRGDIITFNVLDSSVDSCNALDSVTRFRRLIVNNEFFPKRQKSAEIRLERDTSVLVLYSSSDQTPVTLSVWSTCEYGGGVRVGLSQPSVAGQEAIFTTHFDAQFLPGQNVRLEAMTLQGKQCGDTGVPLDFLRWSAGGQVYPDGQTTIQITLNKYTTAVAHYGLVYRKPPLRITSFQLMKEGLPVEFIGRKDEFSRYSIILDCDSFPAEATVSIVLNGFVQAQIISITPTRIEARLPSGRSKKTGVITVVVRTIDESLWSNAIPIVINRQ